MSIQAAQLQTNVTVLGADTAQSQLSSLGKTVDDAGQKTTGFGSLLSSGLSGALGIAGQALGFLGGQFVDSIKAAMPYQQILAQTTQALKSTHDASGMTAQSVSDLAMKFSSTTPFSDDLIQSGENMLLTFTNIGKQVFPQTTQTMLDMAQAMHMGPTQAAMMMGKALDDPAKGLAALQRVGVTFSASEQEQIKTMMAHNNIIGAQKIMLGELNTEFGGSAKAAGQTFAGQLQILGNQFTNLKQTVGMAVMPILTDLMEVINTDIMPAFQGIEQFIQNDIDPTLSEFGTMLSGKVSTAIQDVGHYLSLFDLSGISYAWKQLTTAVGDAVKPLGSAGNAFKSMSPFLTTLRNDFSQLLDAGIRDVAGIISNIAQAIQGISKGGGGGGLSTLGDIFKQLAPPIENIARLMGGEFGKELKDIGEDAKQFGGFFMSSVVPAIKQALPGFENLGKTILTTVIPAAIQIRGVFADVIQHAFVTFAPIIEKIIPPLIKFAGILANDIANGLKFIMPYALQAVKAIGGFADEIMDRVAPIINNFIKGITPVLTTLFNIWNALWPDMSQILQGVWNMIVGIVQIAWAIVTGIIKIGLDLLSGNWKQAWNDMIDMFKGIWDGMKTYFSGLWQALKGELKLGLDEIIGLFTWLWNELVGHSIIPDMINGIVSWFEQLGPRAMGFVRNFISNLTSGLGNLGASALTWAKDMMSQFIKGIEDGIAGVGNAVQKIAGKIAGFLHFSKPDVGPLVDVDNWMPDFGDLLAKGMNDQLNKVSGASLKLASTMTMNLNPASNAGLTALPAGVSGVPSSIGGSPPINITVQVQSDTIVDGHQLAGRLMQPIVNHIRYGTGNLGI